jgi:hypothetical protein
MKRKLGDLAGIPEELRAEYIRAMTTPVTDDDLRGSITILQAMQMRYKPDSIKWKACQLVINQTEALIKGEPSLLDRQVLMRAIKTHYWD